MAVSKSFQGTMKYGIQVIFFHLLASMTFFFSCRCNANPPVTNEIGEDSRDLVMGKKGKRWERGEKSVKLSASNKLKIAFCITGQLARLEILSKLKNVILPNVHLGHTTHLFLLLDDQVDNVKQTFWKFDYSESLFGRHTAEGLKSFIEKKVMNFNHYNQIQTWVRLEPPTREYFELFYNESVPVTDKKFSGHDGSKNNYESAASRFQNNMRWMAGLRECAKWVQEKEYENNIFYDIVVRLRDDSFALGPWTFDSRINFNSLTSLDLGSWRGINDHNFALDRKYIDDFFRGLVEDYYLNHTKIEIWNNPEQHLLQVAEKYHIAVKTQTFCDLPLVPLRGLVNETHWRVHPLYVRYLRDTCPNLHKVESNIRLNDNHNENNHNNNNNYTHHNNKNNFNNNTISTHNNTGRKGPKKKVRKLTGGNIIEMSKKVKIVDKRIEAEGDEEGEEEEEIEIASCCPALWRDIVLTSVVCVHN